MEDLVTDPIEQTAEEKSIEDRLAEKLVPELRDAQPAEVPDEAPEIDDDPPEPIEELEPSVEGAEAPEVEVEIDGEVLVVPERYKDYFLRQKDYTQKTQDLALQRKEVEVQAKQIAVTQKEQQFIGEIQPELNNIAYLDAQINQMNEDLKNNLSTLTSEEMFKKKIEVDGLKEQRQALSSGLEVKYKEFEQEQEQARAELIEQGTQILKQKIPDWNEDKQTAVANYALSKGAPSEVVSRLVEPWAVEIIWEASQYAALQEGVKGAKKTVKAAPTIKPKARSQKQTENDKKLAIRNKLRSGKLSDREKAALIQEEAGERFM